MINHIQYTDDDMNYFFPPSPPYFAPEQEHENQINCRCGDCDGEGGWDVVTGIDRDGYERGYHETCPTCDGRGGGWIDCEPITLEDLELIADELNTVGG